MTASRVYHKVSSLGASTTSSDTPAVKARLTFSPTGNTRYLILAGCTYGCNVDNVRHVIRLLDPSNAVVRKIETRPDSPMEQLGASQFYQDWTSFLYTSPTSPGSINITLDYALSAVSPSQVLTISDAWIIAIKLGSTDYVDEDDVRTVTSSTTYVSKFSGSLPNVARNYVVIASGSMMNAAHNSTAYNSSARIMLDGGKIAEVNSLAVGYVLSGAECPIQGLATINATGGENYSFDYKSAGSDSTSLQDCFLCALDMSTLPDVFSQAKYDTVSTTSSTFQNRLTVGFTAAAATNLLLAATTMSITSATAGKTAEMRVTRNGTVIGELQGIGTSGGGDDGTQWSFGTLSVETLTPNTGYTYNLDYRSVSGGTAREFYSSLFVIQLDGATIYDSELQEDVDVNAGQSTTLSAGVRVTETADVGDITDQDFGTATGTTNSVTPSDVETALLVANVSITETLAVTQVTDASLTIGGAGGIGAATYSDAVSLSDSFNANRITDDVFQFSVAVDDLVAGGSSGTVVSVDESITAGFTTDSLAIIQPKTDVVIESVTAGFGTDSQMSFPIPLSYSEVVYVNDFFDVHLSAVHKIGEGVQDLDQQEMVYLYKLDLTIHGLGMYYFTPHVLLNGVIFDKQLYTPIPISASGFERNASGSMPKPKMQIGNIARTLVEYLMIYDDLVGAVVTRTRTYRRHLDDGSEPDPDAILQPIDIFVIDRKTRQDPVAIEFELTPAIDQDGRQLPARRMIRDTCLWRYRQWDGKRFVYDRVECPYTGTLYFDEKGRPVPTAAGDQCGKRLRDCRSRFGVNATLPYGGFPGAGKTSG